MSGIKYQVRNHLAPTIAPLSAAIGLALSASSLQAATITVTTLADGSVPGQCTLRDALISANTNTAVAGCSAGSGADQIVFAGGLTGTISLAYGQLPMASDMTIAGPGASQLTISGGSSSRVFFATGPLTSEIRGLRLSDGYVNDNAGGAALFAANSSTVTLTDCEISNNSAGPVSYGGGITAANSSLTVNNCQIINNSVTGGMAPRGANNAFGGGLLAVNSQISITGSSFSGNSAGSYGGALALVNSTATVNASGFTLNDALIGGAISVGDGSQLTLQSSYVTDNQAGGGGGIAIGSMGYALLDSTDLYSNSAPYVGGGAIVGVGYSTPTPIATRPAEETVFGTPNFSLIGPGELNVANGYIAFNSTENIGGGLAAKYASGVTLYETDIAYNQATPPVVVPREMAAFDVQGGTPTPEGLGGGLAALDSSYIEGLEVNLRQNDAVYGGGGFANGYGGILLETSIVSNNTADIGGGLLGGFFDPMVMPLSSEDRGRGSTYDGVVGVLDSLVTDNAAAYGGGMASLYSGLAVVKYSDVTDNNAASLGGGILVYESYLFAARATIRNNQSMYGGGVLARQGPGGLIIAQSTISENTASQVGGGLDIRGINTEVKYSTISNNSAGAIGGIVLQNVPPNSMSLLNSTVTGNSAELIGGLYAAGTEIDFATISHNTATGAPPPRLGTSMPAGVLDNSGGANLGDGAVVTNTIFSNNVSPGDTIDLTVGATPGTAQLDYSLVQTPGIGVPAGTGNLTGVDPQLGILAANGGPTLTRAIGPGSPAIDVGNPATTVTNDQRGEPFPRVFNGRADMGAFEFFVDGIFADRFEQP